MDAGVLGLSRAMEVAPEAVGVSFEPFEDFGGGCGSHTESNWPEGVFEPANGVALTMR